jgi:hypothetical protein
LGYEHREQVQTRAGQQLVRHFNGIVDNVDNSCHLSTAACSKLGGKYMFFTQTLPK